jgi:predicted NodU family carbamoyl transferase
MAIVIGFNRPVEHGHTVCAIVDGEFLFASEEKRRTKHKHSPENKSPSLLEEDADR